MQRCIYCKEVMLAKGEAGDARLQPSREHIIPSALGGPDALSTFDVCVGCNSLLGETTDGDLMREHIVSIVRQRFGIPGYSGKIPDIVMNASSMQTGTSFKMRIPHAGDVAYEAPPQVAQTIGPDGNELFQVRGSRKQVEAIVRGKKSKMEKVGRRLLNPDGSELTSIEDSIAAATPEETNEFKAEFIMNQIAVWRGLIKVAFGFAHLVLGPGWTSSAEAEPLRAAAMGRSDPETVAALISGLKVEIRDLLMRDEASRDTRHLIALMPNGADSMIAVSLFGEELLTVAVRIKITSAQLEVGVATSGRMMVTTLPKGGDVQWIGLVDFTQRVSRGRRLTMNGWPNLGS